MERMTVAAAGVCLALVAGAGSAQESVTLQGGFTPDPTIRAFVAQGAQDTAALVRGCPGYAPAAPALIVRFEGAGTPLRLYARGQGLAAMVTVGPDGVYRCGPADASGVAHVRYERALSGDYAFWPATAVPGATVVGEALLSEVDIDLAAAATIAEGGAGGAADAAFDLAAEPAFGVFALAPGLDVEAAVTTAPRADLSGLAGLCGGAADPARPDVVVEVNEPEPQLYFDVESANDTTLAIVAPDGLVYCDDDTFGVDPLVTFIDAAPGRYLVWVGAWGGAEGPATLFVGRERPDPGADGGAAGLDPAAPPAWGAYALPASGPLSVAVSISGDAMAADFDASCSGAIDPTRPDVRVTLAAPEPLLTIAGKAAVDTTLLVLGPDGLIHCDDDSDGFNPAVTLEGASPGDYAIWLGAWGGAEGAAEIVVGRDRPAGSVAAAYNPFGGVSLTSAVQALDIMLAEPGVGDALAFGRLEELGPEGFALHDVVLTDPTGENAPLRIARVTMTDLDLAGLSATGMAERFSLRLDGLDYAALAAASRNADGPPLPALAQAPEMALFASLLPPDGDESRRSMRVGLELGALLGLSLDAMLRWEPGMAAMGPPDPEGMIAEHLTVEVRDGGFVAAALDAMAAADGRSRDALLTELSEALAFMLPPGAPGGALDQLRAALSAKLAAIDAPGVMTLRYAPASPTALGDAVAAALADPASAGAGEVTVVWRPLN